MTTSIVHVLASLDALNQVEIILICFMSPKEAMVRTVLTVGSLLLLAVSQKALPVSTSPMLIERKVSYARAFIPAMVIAYNHF